MVILLFFLSVQAHENLKPRRVLPQTSEERLILELGAEPFEVREKASRELEDRARKENSRARTLEHLVKGLLNPDPEIQDRVRRILVQLDNENRLDSETALCVVAFETYRRIQNDPAPPYLREVVERSQKHLKQKLPELRELERQLQKDFEKKIATRIEDFKKKLPRPEKEKQLNLNSEMLKQREAILKETWSFIDAAVGKATPLFKKFGELDTGMRNNKDPEVRFWGIDYEYYFDERGNYAPLIPKHLKMDWAVSSIDPKKNREVLVAIKDGEIYRAGFWHDDRLLQDPLFIYGGFSKKSKGILGKIPDFLLKNFSIFKNGNGPDWNPYFLYFKPENTLESNSGIGSSLYQLLAYHLWITKPDDVQLLSIRAKMHQEKMSFPPYCQALMMQPLKILNR